MEIYDVENGVSIGKCTVVFPRVFVFLVSCNTLVKIYPPYFVFVFLPEPTRPNHTWMSKVTVLCYGCNFFLGRRNVRQKWSTVSQISSINP